MMAMKRMTSLASGLNPAQQTLTKNIIQYKEESEKASRPHPPSALSLFRERAQQNFTDLFIKQEVMEEVSVGHHHNIQHPSESGENNEYGRDAPSADPGLRDLSSKMAKTELDADGEAKK